MRRRVAAPLLLLLPLVALAGAPDARAVLHARLRAILPDETWQPDNAPQARPTLEGHVAALQADPDHDNAFFVEEVHGPATAERVVFLVPQFHRSPVLPITWSSLGEVISQVQGNIDFLVTRLVRAHGVRCVGTEGSVMERMLGNPELEQMGAWLTDLRALRETAVTTVAREQPAVAPALDTLLRLLTPYLRRQALMLDGVGLALARLEVQDATPEGLTRFGLEDAALNARSLELLSRMRPLEEELALLTTPVEEDGEDALGRMWLEEYPAFHTDVVTPVRAALATLDGVRKLSLREGDEVTAQALGRAAGLARRITDELLRTEEVEGYHRYYQELAARRAEGRGPQKKPRTLKRSEQKRKARLEKELAALNARYEKTAGVEREAAAVSRTLQRVGAGGACVMVMGANHREGLVRELTRQGGAQLGVVVVAPYRFPDE
ncbi:MAG: hypothetical protein AB2A00_17250 [Myxococcota bacterium]